MDSFRADSNKAFVEFQVAFTHNSKGQSLVNVTFINHVNVTKLIGYVSLRVPEDKNDRVYNRELIKTVVDMEKLLSGLQSNPVVKGYADSLVKFVDFKVALPFRPVSLIYF